MARADPKSYTLLENGSATGAAVAVPGGIYMLMVEASGGSSTLQLQIQSPHGVWMEIFANGGSSGAGGSSYPFAASPIYIPAGNVRIAIGSGSPTGIYAYLIGIG